MLKIYKTKEDGYLLTAYSRAIACATLDKLILVMKALEIADEEIELGLSELEINDHNIAEYGVNRTFVFSKRVA